MGKIKIIQATIPLFFLCLLVLLLSDAPYSHFSEQDAMLKIAFKHSGKRIQECDEEKFIKREAERYAGLQKGGQGIPMDVGKKSGCSRERFPVFIELYLDGEKILSKEYPPIGIQKDGASFIYERFLVKPGTHRVLMKMRDGGRNSPFLSMDETMEFKPKDIVVAKF